MRAIAAALIAVSFAALAQPAAQRDTRDGVTISVTPLELAPSSRVWTFRIVLDTHSRDLSDDVAASATLRAMPGREAKPLAWEGSGPGGHHREGDLKFTAFNPVPDSVELEIARRNEAAPRSFRFRIKKGG